MSTRSDAPTSPATILVLEDDGEGCRLCKAPFARGVSFVAICTLDLDGGPDGPTRVDTRYHVDCAKRAFAGGFALEVAGEFLHGFLNPPKRRLRGGGSGW